jgi:hypothetical protein
LRGDWHRVLMAVAWFALTVAAFMIVGMIIWPW